MKRQEMLKFKIEVTTVTKENLVFECVSVCNETWLPVVYQKKKKKTQMLIFQPDVTD